MSKVDLNQATVIVTGGSRGIGPHIAGALVEQGARVALVARSGPELDEVAGRLRESGGEVVAITADLTSRSDRRELVEVTERELGPIDVLVNNAGGDPQRAFHDLSEEELVDVLELNLTSAVILTRLVIPGMLARRRGHIINVSSMAGRTSFPFTEAYGAAKDGLIGFTRVLRGDYRGDGVSASTLILGPVRDSGVGHRTVQEVGIKLPPRALTVSPQAIGRAAVSAIKRDKAEIALLPGPGRTMRAVLDRFPGLGPRMNRVSGAEATMRTVAEHREAQSERASRDSGKGAASVIPRRPAPVRGPAGSETRDRGRSRA